MIKKTMLAFMITAFIAGCSTTNDTQKNNNFSLKCSNTLSGWGLCKD